MSAEASTFAELIARAWIAAEGVLAGYVFDPADPHKRFTVELLVDGEPRQTARAYIFLDEAVEAGCGDGWCGFVFSIDDFITEGAKEVSVNLANLDILVGYPLSLSSFRSIEKTWPIGDVQWEGGLCLSGWILPRASGLTPRIRVLIDGALVAEASANGWRQAPLEASFAAHGFDIVLPQHFADGRAHEATIVDEDGTPVPGSPVHFLAFDDKLVETIISKATNAAEREGAKRFARFMPRSAPFSEALSWLSRFPPAPDPAPRPSAPIAVVLIGEDDAEKSIQSLESQTYTNWVAGSLPSESGSVAFSSGDLTDFLSADATECEFVIFAMSGSIFHPHALECLQAPLTADSAQIMCYSDFLLRSGDGDVVPIALPAFDRDRLFSQGYCCFLFALRRADVLERPAATFDSLYKLVFDLLGKNLDPSRISHAPHFLATCPPINREISTATLTTAATEQFTADDAIAISELKTTIFPGVYIRRASEASLSVVIVPSQGDPVSTESLEALAASLSGSHFELISVQSETEGVAADLDGPMIKRIGVSPHSSPAHRLNRGFAAASGDFICVLTQSRPLESGWRTELLSSFIDEGVAACGPAVIWPSEIVHSAGFALGPDFAVGRIGGLQSSDPGYLDFMRVIHGCAAIPIDGMTVRRECLKSVGLCDETRFPYAFYDVDLCLRLWAAGLRIVFNPQAKLYAQQTGAMKSTAAETLIFARELRYLRSRWGKVISNDPFYNPQLGLDGQLFSSLAWPPRDRCARLGSLHMHDALLGF